MADELPPLDMVALVTPGEHDTILAAAHRLSRCLGDDGSAGWPVRLRFVASDSAPNVPPAPPGTLLVTSLRAALDTGDVPLADVAERWRARIERERPSGPVLLCTLFRHVANRSAGPVLAERIRRLNLLALELSRTAGIEIVDIDRLFALAGARTLDTDHRGQGRRAAALAAHAIVAAALAAGLGPAVPEPRQALARQRNAKESA